MRDTVILIVVGALSMVSKCLDKKLEQLENRGRIEIIKTIALLRSAKVLRRVMGTWGDLILLYTGKPHTKTCKKATRSKFEDTRFHSDFSGKPSAYNAVKNSQIIIIIIIIIIGNKMKNRDNSIVKIGQNTEKSPGNLRRRCHSEKGQFYHWWEKLAKSKITIIIICMFVEGSDPIAIT